MHKLDDFMKGQLEIDQLQLGVMEDFVLNSHHHHQINETPSTDFNTLSEMIKPKIRSTTN